MSRGNKYNEKGMFENAFIRDMVEKGYLRNIGMDPLGQKPLPDTSNMMIPNNWKQRIEEVMINNGYESGPWFYKGAKACLIWPVWDYAFPDAKWIIVRRRSADIATSCLKTGFMHKRKTYEDWISWINHHEGEWFKMMKAGCSMETVWPDRWIHNDYSQIKKVVEWVGLEWKQDEVEAFVDRKLWKAKHNK